MKRDLALPKYNPTGKRKFIGIPFHSAAAKRLNSEGTPWQSGYLAAIFIVSAPPRTDITRIAHLPD